MDMSARAGVPDDMSVERPVLFVIPSLRAGGAEAIMIRVANHLAGEGTRVMLTALDMTGEFRSRIDPRVEFCELGIRRTLYAAPALLRLIRRTRPRLIFSSLTRVSLLLLAFRALYPGRPRIVVRQPSMPSRELDYLQPRWAYRFLYPRLLGSADVIVSQSRVMAEDLYRSFRPGRARVVTINNPVPETDWSSCEDQPAPFPEGINFVCVGRLAWEKGQDVLLEAFSRVAERLAAARLTFVGDGPMAGQLASKAAELGLEDRVHFAGFRDDPAPYLFHADAVVLPSRWEGFPNVLLEALSAGVPVVATDCGGVSAEIVQPGVNGCLVAGENPLALADAMLGVLALRGQGRAAIRQTASRFEASRIMAEYRGVLLDAGQAA